MPAIGVITFELRMDDALSLKDKRHYVKGLKDRLRAKFNVAVAEIGYQDVWQRGLQLLSVPPLWYALFAYGLSVIVWLVGLSRVPVTQAYPLLSLGYVINIGLAWWLLGEVPNAQRVAGVAVIVVGVILVARS